MVVFKNYESPKEKSTEGLLSVLWVLGECRLFLAGSPVLIYFSRCCYFGFGQHWKCCLPKFLEFSLVIWSAPEVDYA